TSTTTWFPPTPGRTCRASCGNSSSCSTGNAGGQLTGRSFGIGPVFFVHISRGNSGVRTDAPAVTPYPSPIQRPGRETDRKPGNSRNSSWAANVIDPAVGGIIGAPFYKIVTS